LRVEGRAGNLLDTLGRQGRRPRLQPVHESRGIEVHDLLFDGALREVAPDGDDGLNPRSDPGFAFQGLLETDSASSMRHAPFPDPA
jgi:hypothetical protein